MLVQQCDCAALHPEPQTGGMSLSPVLHRNSVNMGEMVPMIIEACDRRRRWGRDWHQNLELQLLLALRSPHHPTGSTEEEGFGGGEGGNAFSATPTPVSLPETVAEAVVGAGGLGLASELYSNFKGVGR